MVARADHAYPVGPDIDDDDQRSQIQRKQMEEITNDPCRQGHE